jgi:putative transposase
MGPRRIEIKSADSLFDGHRFRALTIVDNYGRECLATEGGQSMKGAERATVVERLVTERGAPERTLCNHGTEFISGPLDKWAYKSGVTMSSGCTACSRT